MKLILVAIISILTLSVNGQMDPINKKKAEVTSKTSQSFTVKREKKKNVKTPIVQFNNFCDTTRQPAYYVNGKLSHPEIMKTMNPKLIQSIEVKKDKEINGEKIHGQIYLDMKKEYRPKLITLSDLKSKYTSLGGTPTIFMLNDQFIHGDYNQYLVDESYILKIIVDTIDNEKEKLNVAVVRLLTKTEENIKKAEEIRIRGMAGTALN